MSSPIRTRPLYLEISEYLIAQLAGGDLGRLPTESELMAMFKVSRHTARRAYSELVGQGLVERTPGRGTFARPAHRFQMSVASVDDLLALPEGRELHVITPLSQISDATAATKLGLPSDDITFAAYRLVYEERTFALSRIHVPPRVADVLSDVAFLHEAGGVGEETISSVLNRALQHPIAMAKQLITAVAAPPEVAAIIECEPKYPLLNIEYIYFDTDARPILLSVNFYNPDLYEYRAQLPGDRLGRLVSAGHAAPGAS
jgi:GntR family transcriptional regulator